MDSSSERHKEKILGRLLPLTDEIIDECTNSVGLSKFAEWGPATDRKFNSFLSCVGKKLIQEYDLAEYLALTHSVSLLRDDKDDLIDVGPLIQVMESKLSYVFGEEVFTRITGVDKNEGGKWDWEYVEEFPKKDDYEPIILKKLRGV